MIRILIGLTGVSLLLAGCMEAGASLSRADVGSTLSRELGDPPPDGAPGCYSTIEVHPQKFGTVKRAVEVRPAEIDKATGKELQPALYEERDFSAVVEEGETLSYEVLCPKELTSEFIQMVQRSLTARGLYSGRISGKMDKATRAAVHAYQKPRGLDSDTLSRRAAMEMGLVVWED